MLDSKDLGKTYRAKGRRSEEDREREKEREGRPHIAPPNKDLHEYPQNPGPQANHLQRRVFAEVRMSLAVTQGSRHKTPWATLLTPQ